MSWLSKAIGGTKGESAPQAPDLSFLDNVSKFDFLKNPNNFSFLTDTITGPTAATGLANAQGLLSGLSGVGTSADKSFADWINSISAPSSVDQVISQVNSDRLDQILSGIDEDTARSKGALMMDFADRGVSGPGQLSDAEASGLGRLAAGADKTKAGARTEMMLGELSRLSDKEKAAQAAYGTNYTTSAGMDQMLKQLFGSAYTGGQSNALSTAQMNLNRELGLASDLGDQNKALADILNSRDLGKATGMTSIFGSQASNRAKGTPGLLDNFFTSFGQKLGSGSAQAAMMGMGFPGAG